MASEGIRRAGMGDVEAVSSVLQESFAEFRTFYTTEAFAATTPTPDQVRKRLKEGPVWVFVQRGRIVGTVSAVCEQNGLYVRGMAVIPVARGSGIGRRLLQKMEAFAERNELDRLFLSTTPFLHRAIGLYQDFGFRRDDEGPHDLYGTPLFTMVKVLRRSDPRAPHQVVNDTSNIELAEEPGEG